MSDAKRGPRVHTIECNWTNLALPCTCDVRDSDYWEGSEQEAQAWRNLEAVMERRRHEREAGRD